MKPQGGLAHHAEFRGGTGTMPNESIARRCLALTGLFEAELLIELMLRHWHHPLAEDADFREGLLEAGVNVLKLSVDGQRYMEDVPSDQMNLVASVWFVEFTAVADGVEDPQRQRQAWLDAVRRAVPSCFCAQDRLQ
jgi:hypothetical protein